MNEFKEIEVHSDIVVDKSTDWKAFKLSDCILCGRKPSILKDLEVEGDGRYVIRCCGLSVKAKTETNAIYIWNMLQENEKEKAK